MRRSSRLTAGCSVVACLTKQILLCSRDAAPFASSDAQELKPTLSRLIVA
jgi:hypothetical protein